MGPTEDRKIIERLRALLDAVNDEYFRDRIQQLIAESEAAERLASQDLKPQPVVPPALQHCKR